jgi:hypothetical protein
MPDHWLILSSKLLKIQLFTTDGIMWGKTSGWGSQSTLEGFMRYIALQLISFNKRGVAEDIPTVPRIVAPVWHVGLKTWMAGGNDVRDLSRYINILEGCAGGGGTEWAEGINLEQVKKKKRKPWEWKN